MSKRETKTRKRGTPLGQRLKAGLGAASKRAGRVRKKIGGFVKTLWKGTKRPKVVARLKDEYRLHPARVLSGLALTVILAQMFGFTARPARPPADTSCALPTRIANRNISPHWQDVRQWCSLIMGAGQTYGLDPHLIAALILQESGGNPTAYSRSGAVGLMQVMPRDGLAASFQCRAGPCFANRPTISELRDPAFNVDYGARLLAANVTRTGSVREALRAYGPNNVGYRYADTVLVIYEAVKP